MKKLPLCLLVLSLPFACAQAKTTVLPDREPEASTGLVTKKEVIGRQFMVAAANPYAADAGRQMLSKGGSAVDAAVAIEAVLTLVEPQSSGIGGGAFLLHYDKHKNHMTSFDGRETAPSAADETLFLDKNGRAVRWIDAVVGGRSVGVPGSLAALYDAHKKYGKLPWSELFKPAIALAHNGFIVSPRLNKLLSARINPGVTKLPAISDYFFPGGKPLAVGTVKKNPKLAALLTQVAREGINAFYQGDNAKAMVNAVQNASVAPGKLALSDLKNYRAVERAPVCAPYHAYKVCSMAPPSSGGVTVLQILSLLEDKKLARFKPNDAEALHYFTQASRLAFADRELYLADPDFADVPTDALLAPDYLKSRSQLIGDKDMGMAIAGEPRKDLAYARDDAFERPSTSHFSVIDSDGNAVSMTASIEMAFGSTVMVNGYLLNNQLTDFALSPERNGKPVINRVEGGKRPRSSMSPVMVFNNDGSLRLIIGSPGGSRIINYVAQSLIGVLDWGLDAQSAINLPHITNRNRVTTLEKGSDLQNRVNEFKARGHTVQVADLNSGLHAVEIRGGVLFGAADPRREGIALSELSK